MYHIDIIFQVCKIYLQIYQNPLHQICIKKSREMLLLNIWAKAKGIK